MSAISFIELYKLPIDADHKNVFDLGNYTGDDYFGEIYNFLNSQYQSISISLFDSPSSINRAFKNTNGEMMITIPRDYSEIKDYNYALLMRGVESDGVVSRVIEKGIFYFVTGFSSDNQSTFSTPGKPTTTLKLKYDSWMNNLDAIYSENRPAKIVRSHITSYHKYNDLYYPNQLLSESGNYRTIEKSFDYDGQKRYHILWVRLWLDGEEIYKGIGDTYTPLNNESCYPTNSAFPIVCIPYAVFDIVNQEFVSKTFKFDNSSVIYNFPVFLGFRLAETNHIIKADLTYYPPVQSTYDSVNDIMIINPFNISKCDNIYYKNGETFNPIVEEGYTTVITKANFITRVVETIHLESKTSNNDLFEMSVPEFTLIETNALTYPSFYYSIFANGVKTPLIFPYDSDYANIKIISGDIMPKYIIEYYKHRTSGNDKLVKREKIRPLENNGELIHINDSFDTYLRNSGNQTIVSGLQQIKNVATTGAQLFAMPSGSAIKGFENSLFESANFAAKLKDIDRAQDSIFLADTDALSAKYYQDLLMVREDSINNYYDLYKISLEQHLYGQNYPIFGRLIRAIKPYFEYTQTDGCSIPHITNEIERKEVEDIFNKGVITWHINNSASPEEKTNVAKMNVFIGNKDRYLQ